MRSILKFATASMNKSINDVVSDDNDLSTWEVVSNSPSDDDVCSFYGDETISIQSHDLISEPEIEKEEDTCVARDISFILPMFVPPPIYDVADYDDDDDVDKDDLYDDELVTCNFKNRFGKQRVKKMGKSGGPKPKLSKSKKLSYRSNNAGYDYL